jgi:hypothetical protein
MKKLYFILVCFVFCGSSVFAVDDNREEVDFLLFAPDSSNQFVNADQANTQLDSLAQYLLHKNISPGQIIVYGYAAYAPNDIKADDLAKERALFVINQLQKRGVSKELFSDPVAYGTVYQWGDNTDENARKLNRRVRVLLDSVVPIQITQEIIDQEIVIAETEIPRVEAGVFFTEAPKYRPESVRYAPKKTSFNFLWLLLPLLALLAFFLVLFLLGKRSRKQVYKNKTEVAEPAISQTRIVPVVAPVTAMSTRTVNLDEEIRFRAYELSLQRNWQGDLRDQDWYNAVREISALYTANSHSVYNDGGSWWASRSYNENLPVMAII